MEFCDFELSHWDLRQRIDLSTDIVKYATHTPGFTLMTCVNESTYPPIL